MPPVPVSCILSGVKDVKLRRENIVTVLALLVIAATIPFAIMDTIETGRVYKAFQGSVSCRTLVPPTASVVPQTV